MTWEATRACDLACRHCRADAVPSRDPAELDTADAKALVDRVAGFGAPPPVFVLSGGDPLKRADLPEIVDHAVGRGLRVGVTPATTPLLDAGEVRELASAGVHRMALSLDGSSAAAHDAFRGEAGSFAIAVEAAREAARCGLPLQINTTVTVDTAPDLPAVANLVAELGAVMWEVFFLVPVGRGAALAPLGPAATERVLEWLYRWARTAPFRVITVEAPQYRRVGRQIEVREERSRREARTGLRAAGASRRPAPASERRGAGRRGPEGSTGDGNGFVFVSRTGDVFPSGFLPLSAGNVRSDHLVDLYRESALFRRLRDRDQLRGKCGACEFRFVCGGSRARAYAVTGDEMEADPFCPYVPSGYDGPMPADRVGSEGAGAGPDCRSLPLLDG